MEKIISINNQQYKISSEATLTPEQLNNWNNKESNKVIVVLSDLAEVQ